MTVTQIWLKLKIGPWPRQSLWALHSVPVCLLWLMTAGVTQAHWQRPEPRRRDSYCASLGLSRHFESPGSAPGRRPPASESESGCVSAAACCQRPVRDDNLNLKPGRGRCGGPGQ